MTGANGFIGSNVVRSLMREGYEVTALVGPGVGLENLEDLEVEIREFDTPVTETPDPGEETAPRG